MSFKSINPATEEIVAEYPAHTDAEVEAALEASANAFQNWRLTPFKDREELMIGAAVILEDEVDIAGTMLTSEMGKTFAAARGEVLKCAGAMRYFAQHAEGFRPMKSLCLLRRTAALVTTAGHRAGDHAVEFCVMASRSLRGAVDHGG